MVKHYYKKAIRFVISHNRLIVAKSLWDSSHYLSGFIWTIMFLFVLLLRKKQ